MRDVMRERMPQFLRRKPVYRVLMVLLLGLLVWCSFLSLHIWRVAHAAAPRNADVAIVLGAAVWGDKPSPGLAERLDKAIWLYRQKYAPRILVSGGLGIGKQVAEADAMKRYLMEQGIPEEDILTEDQSHDTRENLMYSKQVMEKHQLHTALIVSHGYHLARAMDIAQTMQLTAYPVNVDSHVLFLPYHFGREILAYTYWLLVKSG